MDRKACLLAVLLAVPAHSFAGSPPSAASDATANVTTAAPVTSNTAGATSFNDGYRRGQSDAEHPATAGYSALGFGSGCLMGPCGLFGSMVIADSEPSVPLLEPGHPLDYVDGYRQGYRERLRARRRKSAVKAALIGTVLLTVTVLGGLQKTCSERGSNCKTPTEFIADPD